MYSVDVYLRVRRAVMVDGMSMREAARVFGLHRDTVRKMLAYSVPPGYRRQTPPRRPKLEPFTGVIDRILEDDLARPRKQRHTAKASSSGCGMSTGSTADTGQGTFAVRPRRCSCHCPMRRDTPSATSARPWWSWSVPTASYWTCPTATAFVKAYPAETTEAFLDGHVSAFAFLGGVPQSILYDNTRLAVAKILGDGRRQRTRAFTELQSHYLFEDRFGRPAGVMTKARWRVWWGTRGATSWCPSRLSRALMRSMPTAQCLPGAAMPGTDGRQAQGTY